MNKQENVRVVPLLTEGRVDTASYNIQFKETLPDMELIKEETDQFLNAFETMLLLHLSKAPGYKDSWCKRGMRGIFLTIARKWDRLETAFAENERGVPDFPDVFELPGEGIEEAIFDAAVYFTKWAGRLAVINSQRYQEHCRRVRAEFNSVNNKNDYYRLFIDKEDDYKEDD